MGTTAQTLKLQNLWGAQVRFLRHLRITLGVPLPYSTFWFAMSVTPVHILKRAVMFGICNVNFNFHLANQFLLMMLMKTVLKRKQKSMETQQRYIFQIFALFYSMESCY